MRVAAITPNYPPHSRVGAWLATHQLMRHLVQRGHEVTAFASWWRELGYDLDGVRVETVIRGRDYAYELAASVDVVVSHFGDEGFGAEVAAAVGKPSVRMAHGGGPHGTMGCALAVFNSHSLRDAWGYDSKSIVVHPHTDPIEYRTTPGDRVTLVNLAEAKGGDLFARLAREMVDVEFLGVRGGYGHGEIMPEGSNVAVIATTPHMRDDVYARTRILLMPSEYETWGMVGVEAMASGIPVIASPAPGLLESLGDAGIFVDRDDGRGWVNEIRRLADPVEWEAASAASLARSAELAALDGRDLFAVAVEALCS